VTNSLLAPWDSQFYPEMVAKGGQLLQVDVDMEQGRMR
jgi:selenium-binding protein 1